MIVRVRVRACTNASTIPSLPAYPTLPRRAVVPLNTSPHPEGEPQQPRAMPHCGADLPDEIAVRLCEEGSIHPGEGQGQG